MLKCGQFGYLGSMLHENRMIDEDIKKLKKNGKWRSTTRVLRKQNDTISK